MDHQTRVCLHDACHCRVTGDDLYCSDHCRTGGHEDGSASGDGGCGCGHDQCGGRAASTD